MIHLHMISGMMRRRGVEPVQRMVLQVVFIGLIMLHREKVLSHDSLKRFSFS
jgi:hypothetical protein